uniref:Uncharacterized protein n=1 Tax=Picea glauca TaxID=3330 RepID=A0A101M1J7_PICGL|nr:hypothetical protein ABT39_MTgene3903 [Picea glauca]
MLYALCMLYVCFLFNAIEDDDIIPRARKTQHYRSGTLRGNRRNMQEPMK